MTDARGLHRLVLTAHITTSVGWLGAVVAYLALDAIATVGQHVTNVRAAYFGMEVLILYIIVPLALASVLIGIVNALSSPWGLFQHYWIVVKFVLTLFAITTLLLEVRSVRYLAEIAASGADPRELPGSLPHSIGGLIVLLVTTVLSVYKPRGMTRYSWRKQQKRRLETTRPNPSSSVSTRSQARR
jgi:hypothetical protein